MKKQTLIKGKERDSAIELLRIVSMLMVLLVHADGASVGLPLAKTNGIQGTMDIWRLMVEALVIIGVNCFTLISGYFGIKLRIRTTAAFLYQCLFYAVSVATIAWIVNPDVYTASYWGESWMILTHTQLWYVPAYFLLMLLSPLINAGAQQLTRHKFTALTLAFVALNIWCGWKWNAKFNPTGYTIIQLIMVYMIGRTISMYRRPKRQMAWVYLGLYLIFAAGVYLSSLYMSNLKAFAYNSPLVLGESVALFMTFLSIRIKSPKINFLARSAFAVYLVHKADFVWMEVFKPMAVMHWKMLSLSGYTLYIVAASVAVYLLLVPVDMLRRRLWDILLRLCLRLKGAITTKGPNDSTFAEP